MLLVVMRVGVNERSLIMVPVVAAEYRVYECASMCEQFLV